MDNQDKILLLWANAGTDDEELVATFTGPEARERAEEVKRLKSIGANDYTPHYSVTSVMSNPDNETLGLAPALSKVETSPFVEAAIASIFSHGHATIPAWLNIEWLTFEVEQLTNEKIRIDGRLLRLDPPQKWVLGIAHQGDDDGFIESDQ